MFWSWTPAELVPPRAFSPEHRRPIGRGAARWTPLVAVFLSASEFSAASATQVTLSLVDQLGAGVAGSQFWLAGQDVLQGGTVLVSPGTHGLTIYPGVNGATGVGALERTELIQIGSTDTSITMTWRHANLTVRLVDQFAAQDDSATWVVPSSGAGARDKVGTPTYRLPVTVEQPGDSTYSGSLAAGYDVGVFPSIHDQRQGGILSRVDPKAELDAGGSLRTLVWRRENMTVQLVDQHGAPDDSATFYLPAGGGLAGEGIGAPAYRLPVSVEQPGEPPYSGPIADGYDVAVYPSINLVRQSSILVRFEAKAELDAGGALRSIEWRRLTGPILVGDSTGFEFPGSAFELGPTGVKPTGSYLSIPVTEDSTHAAIAGAYSTGYPVSIRPTLAAPFSGPFTLELLYDQSFSPAQVTVNGTRLGLRTDTGPPLIVAVLPTSGGNGAGAGAVTLTILGQNLRGGTIVKLSRAGQSDLAGTHVSARGLSLDATFDLRGAIPGAWDVVVTNPDAQSASLPGGFTVRALEAPQLRVDVLGPTQIRTNYRTAFDVVVQNQGNVDAVAVPVWLAGIPTDVTVELDFEVTAPPRAGAEPDWSQAPLTLTGAAGRYASLLLPRVPPGVVVVRRFYLTAPMTVATMDLRVGLTPPWSEDEAGLQTCLADAGVLVSMPCLAAQMDAITAFAAANPGIAALNGVGVWAKEAWQCESASTLEAALAKAEQVLDVLVSPVEQPMSLPASCADVAGPRWRQVLTVTVVGAVDPNDKLGVTGVVSAGQVLPYQIRFENLANSSANAQQVRVVDELDLATLDLNTVNLEAIRFDNHTLFPPLGRSQYSAEVDLGATRNMIVRVGASLDGLTGAITWSLVSINRATGQLLDPNSSDGFLPPNLVPPAGEGSVFFTVRPRTDVPPGTEIRNRASLTFDSDPALLTEYWQNTMDAAPPTSQVLPLAATQDSVSFTVRWEASGSPSDLRDYTVYVSDEGGPYQVWKMDTQGTAAKFTTQPGHQYAFYSAARDLSGNIEPAPPAPDAQTLALADAPVDRRLQLALEGARPNPARGAVRAWFTLPATGAATLELIDVSGRRVVRQDVGALGPGRHRVTLDESRALRPGLYWFRLARGAEVRTARVVLIQ